MDGNQSEFVNNTILNTPKPTASSTSIKSSQRKTEYMGPDGFENSLGILSLSAVDLTNDSTNKVHRNEDVKLLDSSCQLQQQRVLANSSLQRANKVSGIPSKYLMPNMINTSSNLDLSSKSTINESDLLCTPLKATSTPKTSLVLNDVDDNSPARLSLGQSMARLSYQVGNTDISIENIVKEFHKAMKSVDKGVSSQIDSNIFTPAEEAASMLFADELSWRRKNDIPVSSSFSQVEPEDVSYGKLSVGAFFQQRSNTLSDFQSALSPTKKKKPVPLIDSLNSSASEETTEEVASGARSLSISAIQKFLAETEDTPRKVTDYLLNHGKKIADDNINDQSLLPVSKDSSYTTDYSENDAMNCIVQGIVADKENIDIHNIQSEIQSKEQQKMEPKGPSKIADNPSPTPSSRNASRTSSALTSLPNGKLPIESTKSELIWGCVKVDKCIAEEFFLRNKAPKKIYLQMSVSRHEFKIRNDNDAVSSVKFMLLPYESRLITVYFIPTKIGAAVDELVFKSLDSNLQQTKKQCIRLFGYGGYGKVDMYNLTKDITGKFWLSLGKLDDQNVLKQGFVTKNTGNLPSFAHISFNGKEPFSYADVKIVPSFFVLIPGQQIDVEVTYTTSMDDRRIFQQAMIRNNMVAEIGSIVVLSGTEVNRGRLRRLTRKCAERDLTVDELSNVLKEKIGREFMPPDLNQFKENASSLKEILKLFTRKEVVLTLEQDPEQTIMPQYPDDSAMFQSLLCQDTTAIYLENSTISVSCKLEPASIILTPPTKIKDSLFLISEADKTHHFAAVSIPEGLEITPKEGVISPRQQIILNLTYPKSSKGNNRLYKVLVYIETEVLEASVKITFINHQSFLNIK